MITLTETQAAILTAACSRPDGLLTRPEALNRTAAVKVAAKLLDQALVQEMPAKLGWPIWRMDEDGRAFSLKILKAGRVMVQGAPEPKAARKRGAKDALPASTAKADETEMRSDHPATASQDGKPGGKREAVIGLLQRQGGASIDDLMAATGWLAHSTRAALTGLRKTGLAIERSRDPDSRASVYRIASPDAAAAA